MNEIFKKYDRKQLIKISLIGIIAGIICGLFSSGGGLVFVLAFSAFLGLDAKKSRGTAIMCMLPIIIATTVIYGMNSSINYMLGIKCACGGIIGSVVGSFILSKTKDKYLNLFFIVFLIYCIIKMILK